LIHSLSADSNKAEIPRHKILSYAGAFADMDQIDYNDFMEQTRKARKDLFDRDVDL